MMAFLRWALVVVNSIAVFVLGAIRQNWPEDFWAQQSGAWAVAALTITAIIPVMQSSFAEYRERQHSRRLKRSQDVEAYLKAGLDMLVRHAGVNWENTGVQAFVVASKGFLRREQQTRIGRVRMSATPPSGIKWAKGKGIIGRCWEEKRRQYVDVERHFAAFRKHDKATWDRMSAQQRYGLSYEDFRTVRDKYGVIAAVPVMDDTEKYVGCITADFPPGATVDKVEVFRQLELVAALASKLMKE